MFKKYFILLILTFSFSYAKSYTIYVASTKYIDVAKKYYHDVKFHIPSFYKVAIREHEKKNYSVIIREIPNIEKAKKIQKLLKTAKKYEDSYIKMFISKPEYKTVKMENKNTIITPQKVVLYKQNIEESNEYITASIMYNTKQYNESYEMFYKLFLKENYNLNINYFLAKSAYNTKRYDEATAAFERVLILKPDFNQARYDYARILYKLKQDNEAKDEFTKLLSSDINDTTKKTIQKFLKVLKQKKNKKRISGSATVLLGFARSSNVNNGQISPEYRLPGFNDILVEGEEPIADSSHFEAINLNLFNYFESQPMKLRNSFLIYNKGFFNEKDQDITVLSYKPALSYYNKETKDIYSLELGIDKILKKSDEDFYSISISPKLANKDYSVSLKYQKIMYEEKRHEDKDFEKIQLFSNINLFKNMNYYINTYKNMRVNDLRIDIDKYTIANGINLFYKVTPNNKLNLNYEFDYNKYKYKTEAFDSKRKDKNHLIELSNEYRIDKTSKFVIAASYIKNNSNQEAYIYDEKAIRVNYLKTLIW